MLGTYSASIAVGTGVGVEHAVLVLAGSAEVVTLDLDVEVELGVGGRLVLEDREPHAIVLANTQVERSPVTNVLAAVTPLAALLGRDALGVDVVLSRGGRVVPLEVSSTVRAGKRLDGARRQTQGNGLRLGT